ncbi:MAG: hypothetical protein K8M05_11845, partial [Deltaproteobacteria bacterium]|nr:hypothetical protein [Kofleriaceae bacterium]
AGAERRQTEPCHEPHPDERRRGAPRAQRTCDDTTAAAAIAAIARRASRRTALDASRSAPPAPARPPDALDGAKLGNRAAVLYSTDNDVCA